MVSHVAGAVVVVAVLPAAYAAGRAALQTANAIRSEDDAALFQALLTYVALTSAFGAVLTVLALLRFSESERRIFAAWGGAVGIVTLGIALVFFGTLTLGFLQLETASPLTERQVLARNARDWLPVITLVTYIGALTWGLFSPAKARSDAVRLGVSAIIAALPGVIAAIWFGWRG